MQNRYKEELIVFDFLKKEKLPGIRLAERDKKIKKILQQKGFNNTPDLIAGPENLENCPLEDLFFIDVIKPKNIIFEKFETNSNDVCTAEIAETIFEKCTREQIEITVDSLPNAHHKDLIKKINNKIKKYAHDRLFVCENYLYIPSHVGLVHHFDFGELRGNIITNTRSCLTFLDYIRLYKSIQESYRTKIENKDLVSAENLLFRTIISSSKEKNNIWAIGKKWDMPLLFMMAHVIVKKDNDLYNYAIIMINTNIIYASKYKYPIHRWIASKASDSSTKEFSSEVNSTKKITLSVNNLTTLFKKNE
jgi:hypothetical protein